ncbi:MAG: heavy metal-binding domain-containing protein [Coriobacteriales bacterium]|nr:heavy metal-binding domain-containing protein [Coriobacteriales bacterium]
MVDPNVVLVVTTESVPGYRIVAMLGEVFGSTSRSNHGSVSALSSSLKPVSRGELVHFTKTNDEAHGEALARLREAAALKGANAVVAMRYEIYAISELSVTVSAYGTAVALAKE